MSIINVVNWIYNFIKPILPIIFVGWFAHRAGKKSERVSNLEEDLDAIRQEKKRRAKREMDSTTTVADRLRRDAREE